jgi:hypothetical protein
MINFFKTINLYFLKNCFFKIKKMDGEQQPVYEQYPNYKDVRGVKFVFNYLVDG